MRSHISVLILLLLVRQPSLALAERGNTFAGTWDTTYGIMTLERAGDSVSGHYIMSGSRCTIEGKIKGSRLEFKYREPNVAGEGWFELSVDGDRFSGSWKEDGKSVWMPWVGTRTPDYRSTFSGVWETTFGRMRLVETRSHGVNGIYSFEGNSTLSGKKDGKKLRFEYREKKGFGEGWFQLSENGLAFEGEWRAKGQKEWQKWVGRRLQPIPGRIWLVALEARWEKMLEEKEFAFGDMLKAFFDRTPNVEVRRRFFTDASSLKRWLEEVAYFPEPTVVTVATHGESDGLKVDGATISSDTVAEGLKYAANLKALHFSSCLVMKDKFGNDVFKALAKNGIETAVSGYRNSVDWAASALFEMTYFDLLLSRGLKASEASKAALNLFPIAGKSSIQGIPIRPGGFEILH